MKKIAILLVCLLGLTSCVSVSASTAGSIASDVNPISSSSSVSYKDDIYELSVSDFFTCDSYKYDYDSAELNQPNDKNAMYLFFKYSIKNISSKTIDFNNNFSARFEAYVDGGRDKIYSQYSPYYSPGGDDAKPSSLAPSASWGYGYTALVYKDFDYFDFIFYGVAIKSSTYGLNHRVYYRFLNKEVTHETLHKFPTGS
jgi:hypothetical protein